MKKKCTHKTYRKRKGLKTYRYSQIAMGKQTALIIEDIKKVVEALKKDLDRLWVIFLVSTFVLAVVMIVSLIFVATRGA